MVSGIISTYQSGNNFHFEGAGFQGASSILKNVDDTKLTRGVSSPEDIEEFQSNLDHLYSWQGANNMEWNSIQHQQQFQQQKPV